MTPPASPHPTAAPSAAGDAVLRLALGMFAADPRSGITPIQRDWVLARLQPPDPEAPWRPLTAHEKARLHADLLAYIETYHPRIADIVRGQFLGAEVPHARA